MSSFQRRPEETPKPKPKPYAFRCERCRVPLVDRWVVHENEPGDPTDDTLTCLNCAGLVPIELVPPPQPPPRSDWWRWLIAGVAIGLLLPAIVRALI